MSKLQKNDFFIAELDFLGGWEQTLVSCTAKISTKMGVLLIGLLKNTYTN
jgi:hypothetical protein